MELELKAGSEEQKERKLWRIWYDVMTNGGLLETSLQPVEGEHRHNGDNLCHVSARLAQKQFVKFCTRTLIKMCLYAVHGWRSKLVSVSEKRYQ